MPLSTVSCIRTTATSSRLHMFTLELLYNFMWAPKFKGGHAICAVEAAPTQLPSDALACQLLDNLAPMEGGPCPGTRQAIAECSSMVARRGAGFRSMHWQPFDQGQAWP